MNPCSYVPAVELEHFNAVVAIQHDVAAIGLELLKLKACQDDSKSQV